MRKTELYIRREEIERQINGTLIGTGVHVNAGGDKGPYSIVVDRLNRKQLDRVIAAILEATGRTAKPPPEIPHA